MKRCCGGGPAETPDSNGIVRARIRRFGRVAKSEAATIIVDGIASAKNP